MTHWLSRRPPAGSTGVERMRAWLPALGHPERALPCIHVAGTNGKGSVSALLESILRAAGWRTGLHTSPHLVHPGERVQVNRVPLSEAEVAALVGELEVSARALAGRGPSFEPSFFEFATAMAFLHLSRSGCDVAIHEAGLGGRFDSTNVVIPEVSVITSIGLDHMEHLGDSLEKIAIEKAGVAKVGVPLVLGRVPPEAEQVIRRVAAEVGAPIHSVREEFGEDLGRYPETSLEGDHQRWNAATATLAARLLSPRWRVTQETIAQGLRQAVWSGRWERMVRALPTGEQLLILDGSHNEEGARALDGQLSRLVHEIGVAPVVVAGVLGLERATSLLSVIARHAGAVDLIELDDPRSCRFSELRSVMPKAFVGPVRQATVDSVLTREDRVIVVTGSLRLAGEFLKRLK